ncbi:MAG: dicarboxylate/amino acid:cation symporter, partial [Bacteroides sp.]|nr:dicarboxylate/amino acid:cation symporter [Bacteroides sp.]
MKTILILFLAVILGSVTGLFIPESWIQGVLVIKQICGEVIFFLVPLIIVGFVAPSIASLKGNVSRLILLAFALAYVSSVGAA